VNDETPEPLPESPLSAEQPAPPPKVDAAVPRAGPPPETRPRRDRGPRPDLLAPSEPVFRQAGGFRLRLDPPDLARLRELPGSRGKTDAELGSEFLESHQARLLGAVSGDVAPPAELRVLVDPYSRQAFLALEQRIKGIVSF
jgi:hypothetical protein